MTSASGHDDLRIFLTRGDEQCRQTDQERYNDEDD